MKSFFARLIFDGQGNPSEHIIFGFLGIVSLWVLTAMLILSGHAPSLTELGIAHSVVGGGTGAGQWMSARADTTYDASPDQSEPGQPGASGRR